MYTTTRALILTVSPSLAFELYLYYQRSARDYTAPDYRGRVIVVPVMVVPEIILGRDWQVVAMPVILLPGIMQAGTSQ